MAEKENFAKLILKSLENNLEKELLRVQKHGRSVSYTGAEVRHNILIRLQELQTQASETIILVPFSPEHIFWVIAIQLRGSSVVYFPKNDLQKELTLGAKRTLILPPSGMFGLGILLRLRGHRVVRLRPKKQEVPIYIDEAPHNPALISFSSGSTGIPKRIERSHSLLIQQHLALKKSFPPTEGQIDFPLFPNILLHNLACGVCTVLPPIDLNNWEHFFAGDILDSIAKEKVSTLTGNLFYFLKLLRSARNMNYTLPGVLGVGIGGSPVPEWMLADIQTTFPNAQVYVIYGSTEAEPIAIRNYKRKRDPLLGYCVGTPHPDIVVKIEKKGSFYREEVKFDWGEICVSGPHVALEGGKRRLNTGDMGYLYEGELYLVGRGTNIEALGDYLPFQIEHYLLDELDLQDVAVVVANNGLRVYYVSNKDEDETIDAVALAKFGDIRIACKRLSEIPKDERHHSKTIYSALDEYRFS